MPKRKILVVDDEESMRYFLNRSLKRKGFAVETVESGEEALTAVERDPPDLILLDLHLPGIDGIEVLRELRARDTLPLVLLMTGFGTVERALDAMREGAADFVTKPFETEVVLAKIEEAFRKAAPARSSQLPVETEEDLPPATEHTPHQTTHQAPPPRPLTAFLREAARARGIEIAETETGDLPMKEASRVFEALYLTELFERTAGNVSLAARIAGVSRPSLHRKITDLGIDVTRFRG
jgi:DNA-binding NtrC family response regulator